MPKLNIYKNEKETLQAIAGWITNLIIQKQSTSSSFNLAIPFTEKIKNILKLLALSTESIDWSRLQIYASKQKVNNEAEQKFYQDLLQVLPLTEKQINFLPPYSSQEESVELYNNSLQTQLTDPSEIDLVLISINDKQSIAFNGANTATNDFQQWVLAVHDEEVNESSICFTAAAINAAKAKAFIATGKDKEADVQQILKGKYNPEKYPAQLIQTANKTVHWFLDEAAAASLTKPIA